MGGDLGADLARIVTGPRYKPGPPCGVGVVLRKVVDVDPAVAIQLKNAIDNPEVSATLIADALRRHGHQVSPQTLSRHSRRGQYNGCRCAL